jgi:hypothetical protein
VVGFPLKARVLLVLVVLVQLVQLLVQMAVTLTTLVFLLKVVVSAGKRLPQFSQQTERVLVATEA